MSTGPLEIHIEGRAVRLTLRHNARARRMVLRIDPCGEGVIVTLPSHVPPLAGIDMVRRQSGWIASRLKVLPERTPFAAGREIPFLGRLHRVEHAPRLRGGVLVEDGRILVTGREEHLSRRLKDWLKAQARERCRERSIQLASELGRRPGRTVVRDTRSRWGSCTAGGDLNFSWRLVLAPERVLDYVVAHEVAHLVHRDHSAAFWKTVEKLAPGAKESRAWLRRHGPGLHLYG